MVESRRSLCVRSVHCTLMDEDVDSTCDARVTVSPKSVNLGMLLPTTPAITRPDAIPARIFTVEPSWKENRFLTQSIQSRAKRAARSAPSRPSHFSGPPAKTMYASPIVSTLFQCHVEEMKKNMLEDGEGILWQNETTRTTSRTSLPIHTIYDLVSAGNHVKFRVQLLQHE